MIHLDRNPDIDQNQKANLILADDHPSSTAAHFPWDPHEHHSDASYANGVLAAPHSASHLDFALAKDPPPSPPHPTLDGTHEDKSSPLSPAPDSASPNHDAKDLPQSHPPPREDPPPFDKGDLDVPREGTLTPLTELSPAPEPDDESDKKDEDDARAGETSTSTLAKDDSRHDDRRKGDPPKPKIINGISSSSSSRSTDGSPIRLLPSTHSSFHNFSADPASSRMAEKSYMFAGPSHSRASSSEYMTPPIMHTAHNMPPPNMAHTSSDAKVIRILDLNAELFKVCMEFQLRGVQTSDPRFYQYCTRLQTNIAWLAAAADQRHHHNQVQLPIMDPPVAVEFSPPRIQHLYSDLPSLFAKDIHSSPSSNGHLKRNRPDDPSDLSATKRRDMGDSKMHGSTSSAAVSPNPMLTGGMPSIAVSGPGPGLGPGPGMHPGSGLGSNHASLGSGLRASPPNSFPGSTGVGVPGTPGLPQSPLISAGSSSGIGHAPSASPSSAGGTGMPSMGGVGGMQGMPGSAPALPFGATEASIAANSRARAREVQIQQARDQHLRQQQHQHHHHQQQQQQQQQAAQLQQMQATAAARHLPPASSSQGLQGQGVGVGGMVGGMGGGMGGGNAGGPGGQPNQSQQSQQVQIQQLLQILQMPAHPLMQHLLQNVPNFLALPQQQQLQKLHMVYQQLMAQRQQHQAAAAAQRNPQMAGMSQNPAMAGTLSNGAMAGGSGNGGGPSPVSPLGQQPPVMTQPQQMSSQQSPQNGMFPFAQGHAGGNSGMDPRMAAGAGGGGPNPNFSQQMAGNMGAMNFNQQRQLSLMQQQQQQQMRNVNGNMGMGVGVSAPGMMGSQQHSVYGMNPRMMGQAGGSSSSSQQQPQPQPHGGAGAGGGSPMAPPLNDTFPTLRSNSTIPGIARSTRSPSDGVHSPMTPRAPSRLSHQQQASNEYQQQVMLQQQQQQQQHAQSTFNQNPNWAQGGQAQMGGVGGMQVNGYPSIGGASMSSPNGVGGMGGGGGFFAGAPSPSNQSWQHGGGGMVGLGGYQYGQSAMGGQRLADPTRSTGQMGGTPRPASATQNMSPIGDGTGNGEYDIFNAYTNGQ
ncbi:hypothetical protein SCLCIDRAFT_928221 [Scleroderma citrinum Foug A]|uniref:Uncharacterized protein n=1 Tax=Scleroderma citrinum Foug A TaxID=1036808 RepID=A0A0C2ZGH9_9AGAM|nr:hypothetical protein SCLCIDRAFT_928221 [Scleroderma citrinum Foug A]